MEKHSARCYAKNWEKGEGISFEQIFGIIDQIRQLGTYIFVIARVSTLQVLARGVNIKPQLGLLSQKI